jgi:hypothetical protein
MEASIQLHDLDTHWIRGWRAPWPVWAVWIREEFLLVGKKWSEPNRNIGYGRET